jgi:hypothetical protein
MTTKNVKIYKLKATDGPLSRDDLSTWVFTVKSYARQHGMQRFISGANKDWICSDEQDDNGFKVLKADRTTVDEEATNKLIGDFHDFLTSVAANCPTGFTDTVIRESTSFSWIVEHIKKTFKLITKGENFLDGINLKFEYDENFTYAQGWMSIKDHYTSSLLPANSTCMGKVLTTKEILSPLAANFLVREWLVSCDPRLPAHVKNTRGHLFTDERPTLACNQSILCDQMEIMLQELDAKDGPTSANKVNVAYTPTPHGRGYVPGVYRGAFPMRGPRPGGRGPQHRFRPPAPVQPRRQASCQICLEARKYDSAMGHTTQFCPFKPELRNITRQQQRPNFKVLFVPSETSSTPASTASVASVPAPAQQVYYDYQQSAPYGSDYPDQYVYEDQLYNDPYNQYEQATIEDVTPNQQTL